MRSVSVRDREVSAHLDRVVIAANDPGLEIDLDCDRLVADESFRRLVVQPERPDLLAVAVHAAIVGVAIPVPARPPSSMVTARARRAAVPELSGWSESLARQRRRPRQTVGAAHDQRWITGRYNRRA